MRLLHCRNGEAVDALTRSHSYFDIEWEGPVLQEGQGYKDARNAEVKGKSSCCASIPSPVSSIPHHASR